MVSDLAAGEFDLSGMKFGGRSCAGYTLIEFDPGSPEIISQDQQHPFASTVLMGRDYLGPSSWTWVLSASRDTPALAYETARLFARVWRSALGTPEKVWPLRFSVDGINVRRVYGRPRRYSGPSWNIRTLQGIADITAEFALSDPVVYEDIETSLTVSILPLTTGGLLAPLRAPLATQVASGSRQGMVTVGGDLEVPFVFRIKGPIANPRVTAAGWTIALNDTVSSDQIVTVDTRMSTATLQNGSSVAYSLSRTSRLNARLRPGNNEVLFEGSDSTGTSTLTIAWRTGYDWL